MKKEIQFTKNYSTFKKGDKWKGSRDLMASAVRNGVALYVEDVPKKVSKSKTNTKK